MTDQAFFRPAHACKYLGVCRTKLHNLENSDPDFPRKIRISARCVGWTKDQLDEWLNKKSESNSGCFRHKEKAGTTNKDLSGQKFGLLTVVRDSGKRYSNNSILWECECDCGERCEANTNWLVSGKKSSCGCLRGAHWRSIDELGAIEEY